MIELPPLYLLGVSIFITLFVIHFVVGVIRHSKMNIDSLTGFMFTAFETALAVYASIELFHFTFYGKPYPGSSIEEIQLSVSLAAVALLCSAGYQYVKRFSVGWASQIERTCPKCATRVSNEAKFCSNCGEELK